MKAFETKSGNVTGIAAAALNAPSREYENRENTDNDDDDGVSYQKPRNGI